MVTSSQPRVVLNVRTMPARRVLTKTVVTLVRMGGGEQSVINTVRHSVPRVLSLETARPVRRDTSVLSVVRHVLEIVMANVNLIQGRVMLVKVAIMDLCAISNVKIVPIVDVIKMELVSNVSKKLHMD